jgi:D-arginine dehydrogenase
MQADVIVIGGGIAGLSAAFFLAPAASVVLLEREGDLGYHSSGRTAAQFTVGISAVTMRRLAAASRDFFERPPSGFVPEPLLLPRGCLTVGRADQEDKLARIHDQITSVGARSDRLDAAEALALFPALRPEGVDGGVFEPEAMDIDVNTLLQGYARGAKGRGAQIVTGAGISAIRREAGQWIVETPKGEFSAPMLLNAAGAWVDEVTVLAGLAPIGVTPHRRTAFTFAASDGFDPSRWPHVSNVDYQWYVKPEAGQLMGSLAEAVPTQACDVYPDDMDVAQGVYNIEQDTRFRIARPLSQWAGLRNFTRDRNPVAGTCAGAEGFFWLAGQGGCGVLTSPALGQATAALMLGQELPQAQRDLGITADDLSPERPTLAAVEVPIRRAAGA